VSTLPETLVRFRSDLELAIDREHSTHRSRRKRRTSFGLSIVVATAAIALALTIVLPDSAPSVIDRAAAALNPRGDTILHTKIATRWVTSDGVVETWVNETWQERRRPYAQRSIYFFDGPDWPGAVGGQVLGKRRVGRIESASSGFDTQVQSLFDPRTNTIYVLRPAHDPHALRSAPAYCAVEGPMSGHQRRACAYPFFQPGPRPGTIRVVELTRLTDHRPFRWRVGHRIVSEKEAHAIMERLFPNEPIPESYRDEILQLLKRPDAVVDGHVPVAGRDAVTITWNSGRSVYVVDAKTYDPIELRTKNKAGVRATRFLKYERLPLTAKTQALLRLKPQHPTAQVSHDRKAYVEAGERLTPHG
jgi:hypothetical protein